VGRDSENASDDGYFAVAAQGLDAAELQRRFRAEFAA